ncbi:hypothetical protein HK100_007242 [Physocladia obscura]|uniref:Sulfatase N-terminal domain-containing protein n=1 Tax=Physocladia obscura TaxID=109957 RepID=A0AAD5T4T9_9FUNG|nr:hypothetical protein HK100_007242 [Physocladia obscura]
MEKSSYIMYGLLHVPGLFLLDTVVAFLLIAPASSIFVRRRTILRLAHTVAVLVLIPFQTVVSAIAFAYFLESNSFIDWFVFEDVNLARFVANATVFKTKIMAVLFISSIFVAANVVVAWLLWRRNRRMHKDYAAVLPASAASSTPNTIADEGLPESLSEFSSDDEGTESTPQRSRKTTAAGVKKWRVIITAWFSILASLSYFLVIQEHSGMARLSENFLISPPLTFLYRAIRREKSRKPTRNIPLEALSRPIFSPQPPPAKITLYTGPIFKNVVLLVLESLRADILDYKPTNSHLARIIGEPSVADFETTISPTLNALKHKSLFFPRVNSASAYTLKSLLSTFCSVYPLKGAHVEYGLAVTDPANPNTLEPAHIYAPCLPQILHDTHKSAFFSAATLDFDHHAALMDRMGFSTIWSIDAEDAGALADKAQWLNYFGVDDREILPRVMQFMDDAAKGDDGGGGSPFFVSLITNAGHHPFAVPRPNLNESVPALFAASGMVADYLNAVNNVDGFVREMLDRVDARADADETIVVLIGDHGMGLGDHGILGTAEGSFREAFEVPLLFYSKNAEFQENVVKQSWLENVNGGGGSRTSGAFASSLDVLPTILEFLGVSDPSSSSNGHVSLHEGISLLRDGIDASQRPLFLTSNPWNKHAQIYMEDGMKLVLDARSDSFKVYNLTADPLELGDIYEEQLTIEEKAWVEDAREKVFMANLIIEAKYHLKTH